MNLSELQKLKVNPRWAKLPLFDRSKWQRVRFGDVVENLNETCNPVKEGIERFIGLEHLEPGSLHVKRWGDIADGTTFTRRVRSGQVLFGKRRAYQRKVAMAEFDAVVSGDIYILAPKNDRLLSDLLPFLCLSERFFQHAVGTSAGSLSPRTNWGSLGREVVETEKQTDPAEERDRAKEALTELFSEAKSKNTHIIVERIVADIDDIVKKVRFPDWQRTSQGERLVQRELRKTLLRYRLHTDEDLFDKAYGYIRQYY